MTHQAARRLAGIALGIAVAGLGWQMVPLRPRLPSVSTAKGAVPPPAVDATAQAAALLTYGEIVRRNPFDPGRQPPRARYVPPELRARQPAPVAATATPRLRLVGVAAGPGGAVALIDANPSIPGAEIYRVGDRVGSYRIEAISDTSVVLRDPSGVRTLQLESLTGRSR